MYTVHDASLGATPTQSEPSLWDSFSNLVSSGVTAGFNIYNKVQQVSQQQKATTALKAQAAAAPMYAVAHPGAQSGIVYAQGQASGGSMLDGWTVPLLFGSGALVILMIALKK